MKETIMYKIVRPFLYLYMKIKYNPVIINKEEIPKEGSIILAGNHTNNLDCLLLGYSTKRCIRFIAKDELVKGIKKYFFKAVGIIPVNRKIHDKSVIPKAVEILNNKEIIGIFPEGTINRTENDIIPFKKGAIKMSLESKSYIIPFAINGIYEKNKISVIFGEKYYPKTNDIEKETKELENKVKELIKKVRKWVI